MIPLIKKLMELYAGKSSLRFEIRKKAHRTRIAHGYAPLMERYSGEISEIVFSMSNLSAETAENKRNRQIFCF